TSSSLADYLGSRPLTGIKTGFNEAYLIDTPTKEALIEADPKCARIISPYVRGSDIGRWTLNWDGMWMIAMKSSGDHSWPWTEAAGSAEEVFRHVYPSLYAHFAAYEHQLRKRQDQGRYWWELRSCAYWDAFASPKLFYQLIMQYERCRQSGNLGSCWVEELGLPATPLLQNSEAL
ncbi:MAG: hypothetical protein MUF23_07075, partial [Pirellula sp.]|nr:hypothetical protein [Pirellula sp.]